MIGKGLPIAGPLDLTDALEHTGLISAARSATSHDQSKRVLHLYFLLVKAGHVSDV